MRSLRGECVDESVDECGECVDECDANFSLVNVNLRIVEISCDSM